jgi:hypothetical protein
MGPVPYSGMRSSVPYRVATLALMLLLGATSTGMPSHHHDTGRDGPVVVDANHHGHGVLLVDTSERVVTQAVVVALPAPAVAAMPGPISGVVRHDVRSTVEPPQAQPPPSARPRAPPVHG